AREGVHAGGEGEAGGPPQQEDLESLLRRQQQRHGSGEPGRHRRGAGGGELPRPLEQRSGQRPAGGDLAHSTRTTTATPWPTPMQAAATPYPPPRRRNSRQASTITRGAEAPSGWPIAMAPPFGLTRSSSMVAPSASGRSCRQESTIAANASLIPQTAMAEARRPARVSTLAIAGTGATENRCGSTAMVALATTRPSGSTASSAASEAGPTRVAIAPSLIGEELPAVTAPPATNAGPSAASFSAEVSRI